MEPQLFGVLMRLRLAWPGRRGPHRRRSVGRFHVCAAERRIGIAGDGARVRVSLLIEVTLDRLVGVLAQEGLNETEWPSH